VNPLDPPSVFARRATGGRPRHGPRPSAPASGSTAVPSLQFGRVVALHHRASTSYRIH
jgi:hypothetical protein